MNGVSRPTSRFRGLLAAVRRTLWRAVRSLNGGRTTRASLPAGSPCKLASFGHRSSSVSYTHLRAHETGAYL
eukprot:9218983-Pyramimonas_sp.AAC.1